MKLRHVAVAAIALAASPAFAMDDGFYVEGGIGHYQLDIGGGWDAGDMAYKLGAGYNFAKYFGAEVEWIDGGSPDDHGISVDISGWNFSAIGRWPVDEKFSVFGKLGVLMWDANVRGFLRGSNDGTDLSWGLGAGWNFTDHFTVNAEYQGFDIADTNASDLWIASAVWRF
jgi:OmpA-OmpF porin, OOP family